MSEACLTINFKTKIVSLDGKVISLEHLNNGSFHTHYDHQEWRITTPFKLYGHDGNEIFVKQTTSGLEIHILIWAGDGHLVDSQIVKKLKSKYRVNLKTQHNSRVDVLDTAWKHAYLEYDIRYSGISLVLKE